MDTHRFLAAGLAVAAFAGCSSSVVKQGNQDSDAGSIAVDEVVKSALARQTSPSISTAQLEELVAGNNAFAFALHQKLKESGKNSMSSPYSVSLALAMTWAGARGTSESQMASALHFSLPQETLHSAFDALDLALAKAVPCYLEPCDPAQAFKFKSANSAWLQQGFAFQPAYLDTLAVDYGVGVHAVDFVRSADPARLAINGWVSQATEGKIKDLLGPGSVDSSTRLVLANAVYFKGFWENQFDPTKTALAPFRLLDGSSADVATMNQVVSARGYSGADYEAVELPYRLSRFAMLIVAPAVGTFETFESKFDASKLAAVETSLETRPVTLALPRFKFEWKKSLVDVLRQMGIADLFDPEKADLSGIAGTGGLYVSEVIHQTFVALDEMGTEAAAATAVAISGSGLPPPPISVKVDRPFLFAIRETSTGQIVFLGRVVDPR